MEKKVIRQKLMDYLTELKMNLGFSKSFEVVFNYIDFIKADSYLKELMKPFLEKAEKEIENIFDLYEKEKEDIDENDELSMNPIEISPEEIPNLIPSEIPIFGEELAKMGHVIKNNTYVNIMFFKHLYFTLLFSIYYKMSKVKKLQEEGKKEEALEIIEEIKETSIFPLPGIKIGTQPETERTIMGQNLYKSMFMINKYIIDEIDSQMFLDNEKPKERISFNKEESILYIDDFKIKIARKNDKSLDHYILELLFAKESIHEQIDFSELSEYLDNFIEKKKWGSWRHACDKLNKKIEEGTNYKINKFIEYTTGKTGYCKISKKYL